MRSDLPDPDSLPDWNRDRWGWAYEPDHRGAPAYRRPRREAAALNSRAEEPFAAGASAAVHYMVADDGRQTQANFNGLVRLCCGAGRSGASRSLAGRTRPRIRPTAAVPSCT